MWGSGLAAGRCEGLCARFQIVGLGHCHTHTDADVVKARLNSVTVDQEFSPSVNSAGGRA